MTIQYYASPNNVGDFSLWWGSGGAELFDKLDPGCITEPQSFDGKPYYPIADEVGPFEMPMIGMWEAKAHAIPGYSRPDDGQTAITFRQAKGEREEPVEL